MKNIYAPGQISLDLRKRMELSYVLYTLREYIELYRKRSTTVFVTFLDASKAFDRLDHWLLFQKLIKRKVPLFVVWLLIVWYLRQSMHIRWGNTFSTSFCVSNGVKQGGVISPVLFKVYMDDLSCALNRSNIGGRIGGEIVNHLSYSDDLCLICLSSAGMQKLLNVCSNYATEHSLSYNANKSYSLCFNYSYNNKVSEAYTIFWSNEHSECHRLQVSWHHHFCKEL